MVHRQILAALLSITLAVQPALASGIRAVTPGPKPVRAPVTTLGGRIGGALGTLGPQSPALKTTLSPTLAPISHGLSLDIAPELATEKAIAIFERAQEIETAQAEKSKKKKQAPAEDVPAPEPAGARELLQQVNSVMADYSVQEIKDMPAEELSLLAGAILDQGKSPTPRVDAAELLPQARGELLLKASGAKDETELKRGAGIDRLESPKTQGRMLTRGGERSNTSPLWRRIVEAIPSEGKEKSILPWRALTRYAVLGGILGALAFLPALAGPATIIATLKYAFAQGLLFNLLIPNLGFFANWAVLIASAVAFAWAGIPLRNFTRRLSPRQFGWGKHHGDKLKERSMWFNTPMLILGAVAEELVWRGFQIPLLSVLFLNFLPLIPAVAAASLLGAFVFAASHGYGPVWTRVVGGLIYSAAFLASGTLIFPILIHLIFNTTIILREKYDKAQMTESAIPLSRKSKRFWARFDPVLIGEKIYAVHATRRLPIRGRVRTGSPYPSFRPALHWNLGELVRSHGRTSWDKYPYAVVAPLNALKPQLTNLYPRDTITLGDFHIQEDSVIVVPKGTPRRSIKDLNVVEYDPETTSLREAVDAVIRGRNGWPLDTTQGGLFDAPAYLAGRNITGREFFRPFLGKIADEVGVMAEDHTALGQIDGFLIYRLTYYAGPPLGKNSRIAIGTEKLSLHVALMEFYQNELRSLAKRRRMPRETATALNRERRKLERWLTLFRVDLAVRAEHGRTAFGSPELRDEVIKRLDDPADLKQYLESKLLILKAPKEDDNYRGAGHELHPNEIANLAHALNPEAFDRFLAAIPGQVSRAGGRDIISAFYTVQRIRVHGYAFAEREGSVARLDRAFPGFSEKEKKSIIVLMNHSFRSLFETQYDRPPQRPLVFAIPAIAAYASARYDLPRLAAEHFDQDEL